MAGALPLAGPGELVRLACAACRGSGAARAVLAAVAEGCPFPTADGWRKPAPPCRRVAGRILAALDRAGRPGG